MIIKSKNRDERCLNQIEEGKIMERLARAGDIKDEFKV